MATTSPIQQLTSYSDADLKAAAAKLQASGYSRYSPTYILNQAKTDATMASSLLKYLPATPGSTTAAKPAAPATILPDPAKATTQSTTVSGKTYYLSPAKSGQPATWVTQAGSNPGLFAVDQTGKVTGTKPTFTSTLDWQNQTAVAFGASKPTAPPTATAPDLLTTAKSLGFNDVASYNAALKASNAAGFGNDINKYQIYQAAEAAKKTAASKAADEAKAKAAAEAKAVADAAAVKAAEAKRLEQEQIARAQAEYERAEAARKQVAEQQAATQKAADLTALSNQLSNRLPTIKSQAELDAIIAEAQAAGATLNQGQLDRAKTMAQQYTARDAAAKQQTLEQQYIPQLTQAQTQADIDRVINEAKAAGLTLNQGQIDAANQRIAQATVAAEQQRLAQLSQQYQTQLGQATTQEQFDSIVKQARDAGAAVNTGFVDQYQKSLTQNLQQQEQQRLAQEQARIQSEQVGLTLPAPGTEQFGYSVANGFDITAPDGTVYRAVPQNLQTGQPGGWYQSKDSGSTWTSWQDGRATGPAIPQKEFQQQIQSIGQSNATFTQAQETAAREQASIQNLAGQQRYAAAYQQLQASGQPFTSQDIIQLGNQQAEQTFQQQMAESEALKAESRERVQQQINPDYGPFDDMLYVALAAMAIGAVAGSMGASLGTLGTEGAVGAAEAGTAASEAISTASTLAEAGATASEVSTVMESIYGIPTTVAESVGTAATNLASGALPAAEIAASAGFTPEMLAIANATADPIAAMNALAGWTGADMAYLAGIGMPASVMAAAAATNAGLGLPTTVAEWSAATGTQVAGGGAVAPETGLSTTPVSSTPGAAGPGELASTGISDSAPGTIFNGPNGPEIVLDSGKTVSLAEYEAAIASGQPISVDGLMVPGGSTPITGIEAVAPEVIAPEVVTAAPVTPGSSAGVSAITDAQFVAADAAQLAAQGLSQAQIESTLLFSGVDPLVAADAAALASSGLGAGAIAPALEQSGAAAVAGGAPEIFTSIPGGIAEPLPGYAGPPGSAPIYGTNVPAPVYDYSVPYVPGKEPTLTEALGQLASGVKEALPSVGLTDALAVIGAANVLGPILVEPPKVQIPSYGPLPPIEFGKTGQLDLPGTNPGYFTSPTPFYQTTSPVQSQFFWGTRPLQTGTFSQEAYNQVPGAPAVPFGIRGLDTPTNINEFLTSFNAPRTAPLAPVVPQTQV